VGRKTHCRTPFSLEATTTRTNFRTVADVTNSNLNTNDRNVWFEWNSTTTHPGGTSINFASSPVPLVPCEHAYVCACVHVCLCACVWLAARDVYVYVCFRVCCCVCAAIVFVFVFVFGTASKHLAPPLAPPVQYPLAQHKTCFFTSSITSRSNHRLQPFNQSIILLLAILCACIV
jgi:hypothetical protein